MPSEKVPRLPLKIAKFWELWCSEILQKLCETVSMINSRLSVPPWEFGNHYKTLSSFIPCKKSVSLLSLAQRRAISGSYLPTFSSCLMSDFTIHTRFMKEPTFMGRKHYTFLQTQETVSDICYIFVTRGENRQTPFENIAILSVVELEDTKWTLWNNFYNKFFTIWAFLWIQLTLYQSDH